MLNVSSYFIHFHDIRNPFMYRTVTDISKANLPYLLCPFPLCVHSLLGSFNLSPFYIHPASHFSLPPWEVSMIHVGSRPLPLAKPHLPPKGTCSVITDYFHSHSYAIAVYTDDSKFPDGVEYTAAFPCHS